MIGASELVGRDLTYRQLDYWARCGYVRSAREGAGSGRRRVFSELEVRIVRAMARLVAAGLEVPLAADIARRAVKAGDPTYYVTIGDGVYLSLVVDVDGEAVA